MKKILLFILSLFIFNKYVFAFQLKSSILIDASTGKILMEENSNERMYPASMTKMMTLLIAMEEIEKNNIKLEDIVVVSDNASKMGGSQVFLNYGEEMSVDDLIRSICIASANDSAVALAEYISGTEEKFVFKMNLKAKELGLSNTNFTNVHGLHDTNHYSCSNDMAIIARELLKYENILKYTSTYEDYLKKNDGSSIWMVNTNKLIRYYKGLDGLKTGYTNEAGYCLTATAKRNNMRLISVVMGEESSEIRSKDTIELLDYGFNNYKLNSVYNKNIDLGRIKIKNGKDDYLKLKLESDIVDLVEINEESKYDYKIQIKKTEAPIKKDERVGILELYKNGKIYSKYNILATKKVEKANIVDLYLKNIKYYISGNI